MKDADVVLQMEVKTFYWGKMRKGIIECVAKKTTKRMGIKTYWIRFPNQPLVHYQKGHCLKTAHLLKAIPKPKPKKVKPQKSIAQLNKELNSALIMAQTLDKYHRTGLTYRAFILKVLQAELKNIHVTEDRNLPSTGSLKWSKSKARRGYLADLTSANMLVTVQNLHDHIIKNGRDAMPKQIKEGNRTI